VEIPNTEDFWPVNHVYGIQEIEIFYEEVKEQFYVYLHKYGEGSEIAYFLKYVD